MKKKVYIISHSHWDREWYLPYEQHHMRAVQLLDDVLELIEKDPAFNSFHLDGQTIILDDYLQVRPEQKTAVEQAVRSGKLRIGPFYILQDDFLISAEANVRNMQIGFAESRKWGTPVMLGYFPDTFGNMGQTPQMMRQAGLAAAAFGRGVKPIGFDNEVLEAESYASQYSEMRWQGPDQSEIFGLLFANWYSNGNEIPAEKAAAEKFWRQKLADVERFAATDHLLMMNGVDHQPVQKNVTAAIALANELFPDYEFIHSNFDDYLAAVQKELPADIGMVTGELTSQETDGWYTLANTSSARVYLKQWNTKVQRQLENVAEPLAAMAYELTGSYPHDQLNYAWKTLLQNHPHDSICGCSVDEVHRGMLSRFENAYEVAAYTANEAAQQLAGAIDTSAFPADSRPFVVFNTSGAAKSGLVTIEVELERRRFAEGVPAELYQALAALPQEPLQVITAAGQPLAAEISEPQVKFAYDLPRDAFRVPHMKRYVTVTMLVNQLAPFSWETFALQSGPAVVSETGMVRSRRCLENERLQVTVAADGSLTVTDKLLQKTTKGLLVFEDVGDVGNEYIFKQPQEDQGILSTAFAAETEIITDNSQLAQLKVTQELLLPVAADERLALEQQMVVEFRQRQAQRSSQRAVLKIETVITMYRDSSRLDFATSLDNQMKDHRLRVLFPTGLKAASHEAESIFEVVQRPNSVSSSWENPTNPQHQQSFVNIHTADVGFTVGNYGLNEYEILPEGTIALTLLRAVGEMGDWGYFPTPEAQCLGPHAFQYSLQFHGTADERFATYQQALAAQVPFTAVQLPLQQGSLAPQAQYVKITGEHFAVTALKRRAADDQLVMRGYNMSGETVPLFVEKTGQQPELLDLLEEHQSATAAVQLKPYEIRTLGFKSR